MKSIMISIKPEWVEKIINKEKTVEIRKTMPKCKLPIKVYIYETKGKFKKGFYNNLDHKVHYCEYFGKGKIVAEFLLDKVECFTTDYRQNKQQTSRICEQSCLSFNEMAEYETNSPCLYAWHISHLNIYDKPKLLQEFFKPCDGCDKLNTDRCTEEISYCKAKVFTRPPQSWCYTEKGDNGDE